MDRRKFLQLMGLVSGTTLLSSCGSERNQKELISYLVPPEDGVRPGTAAWRVSTCSECPAHCGITVRLREGRAVKLEGNPDHPVSQGALCMRGQAALWRLYHPQRLRTPLLRTGNGYRPIGWDEAMKRIAEAMTASAEKSRTNMLLTGSTSGSLATLQERFADTCRIDRLPEFEFFNHAALRQAYQLLYGRPRLPRFGIEDADLLVTVGADLLETFISPVGYAHQLSVARREKGLQWSHIEPHLSLTGANADRRLTIRPGSEATLLLWLLQTLAKRRRYARRLPQQILDALPKISLARAMDNSGLPGSSLTELARSLEKARHPLLITGGVATAQLAGGQVALLGCLLQWVLTVPWQGLDFDRAENFGRAGDLRDLQQLNLSLQNDEVGVLIISRTDPVRHSPQKWRLDENLRRARLSIAMTDLHTATSRTTDLILPLTQNFERWDDVEPRIGIHSLIQPAMAPLHNTRSEGDILLELQQRLTGRSEAATYEKYLQQRWKKLFSASQLRAFINKGFVTKGSPRTTISLRTKPTVAALRRIAPSEPLPAPATVITGSIRSFDGRSAVLPLLGEIPDPLTTVTHGNWVTLSPRLASQYGVKDGEELRLTKTDFAVAQPARLQPGLPDGIFGLPIDSLTSGPPGIDPATGEALRVIGGIKAHPTGKHFALPILSGSPSQKGRGIIPKPIHRKGKHHAEHRSLYPEPAYRQYRWAMAIDLKRCIGCAACVASCYVENSVPVVGREEHLKGREMSWLRIEPFYDDQGRASFIPMLCQHCDYAPCEPVCPVYAAYHNPEGLNVQVYNRCVGTRYCSNNCPYKVRRFNWWQHKWAPPLEKMHNPDLAPRSKGMMEKCTFCIQRIRTAHETAGKEDRLIRDGEVIPACAQSCPTDAITFGNLLDPQSAMARLIKTPRTYRVFEGLGTEPAVYYLRPD
jgi:molybdopterin-containing oxidoreductase family iron-sulfur binding subunit